MAAGAERYVPSGAGIEQLELAARSCQGCDLYRDATQTVFGAGPADAAMVIVGEQPGDVEDRRGQPFVGPAGRLLNRVLEEAGIDRRLVYVTNAVKHFKFEARQRGKPRIHKRPSRAEIVACRPWLLAELDAVKPSLILCLGAVAAQSLLGPTFRLTRQRGQVVDTPALPSRVIATIHPAAVLRADDPDPAYLGLLDDIRTAAAVLGRHG